MLIMGVLIHGYLLLQLQIARFLLSQYVFMILEMPFSMSRSMQWKVIQEVNFHPKDKYLSVIVIILLGRYLITYIKHVEIFKSVNKRIIIKCRPPLLFLEQITC